MIIIGSKQRAGIGNGVQPGRVLVWSVGGDRDDNTIATAETVSPRQTDSHRWIASIHETV